MTRREQVRPAPLTWPGGRTGLVQVCLDSPADRHDREVAFWRSALDWRWADGDHPEFAGKLYPPPDSTVQLLFQRLGADDPGTTVRAHIDLGTDQRAADAARLQALGAVARRDASGMDRAARPRRNDLLHHREPAGRRSLTRAQNSWVLPERRSISRVSVIALTRLLISPRPRSFSRPS